ncbi:MAG TPA: hypothetical protein VEA37_09075 [Flavobacterium sp.]|nr:hypothetical protein [Flavobacterium sp.]
MATRKKVPPKQKATNDDDDLIGDFVNTAAIDDMFEGIEQEIPAYKTGSKLKISHKGTQLKVSVLKVLDKGKLKVVDGAGNVYEVGPDDIVLQGEDITATRARVEKETKAEKQAKLAPVKKKSGAPVQKTRAKSGEKTQREKVEELAEAGMTDYDEIAKKSGVERTNVSQYMYRWKKAKEAEKEAKKKK